MNGNNGNRNVNVIFFSKRCRDCTDLITLLQNENLLSNFVMFCVDGRLKEVPSHITVVPTMIVSGINKPLVGKEPFEWVNKVKFLRQQSTMSMNKQIIMQQNLMRMANKKGPHGFLNDEMNGISDTFAYTKTDVALPHRYVGANDDKNAIFTALEQSKISKDEQQKRMEQLELDRTKQDSHFSGVMKTQQLHAVMQSEQNNNRR